MMNASKAMVLLALGIVIAAHGAASDVNRTNGQGGCLWNSPGNMSGNAVPKRVLELPPSSNNCRNSEGDFAVLNDGRILYVYSHYLKGKGGDHDPAILASRVSSDGGMTWSTNSVKVLDREGDMNVMSVSLLRLEEGPLALFYVVKNSEADCRPAMRLSTDDGATWGPRTMCVGETEKGYYVLNNARVVRLKSGRLVLPLCGHASKNGRTADWRGRLVCYLSDDAGRSWRRGKSGLFETYDAAGRRVTTQEPGVIELKDGRVLMFVRTMHGRQWFYYSSDGCETWTRGEPGSLWGPCGPATVRRLANGDLVAIWNDHEFLPELAAEDTPKGRGGRRVPLTVAISKDEGRSWPLRRDLETDPKGWYCYIAALELDGRLLLGYCAGDGLSRSRITSVPLSWLYAAPPLPPAVDSARSALLSIRDGSIIKLPRGTYAVNGDGGRTMMLAPSNNSRGEKRVAFPIVGRSNVTIDGGDSTFVIEGKTFPFAILGCTNVTLKNFTITTKHPSCAGFTVTAKDESGFTVRFAEGTCPYRVKDGDMAFDLDGQVISTRDGRLSMHALERIGIHYLMSPNSPGDKGHFPATFVGARAAIAGPNTVRFTYYGDRHPKCVAMPYAIGEPVVINLEERRERDAFLFEDCEGVTIENVKIRRFGGMGVVAQRSGDICVNGLVTQPESGDRVTLTADIMQFINCHGKVTIENCSLGDSLDDALNIHGNYLRVEKIAGNTVSLRCGHPSHAGFFPYRRGDTVEFVEARSRKVVRSARITGVVPDEKDAMACTIELDGEPIGAKAGMLVENATLNPDVTMRNNYLHNYPQVRLSGRGKYLLEGNTMERSHGAFLFSDLAEYWFESGRMSTIEIRNNTFRDCNALGGSAFITASVSGWGNDAPKILGEIHASGNRFLGKCNRKWAISGVRRFIEDE